ncbi:olfactory receptor-like protein OLF4 [Suncus etruscus]|uniref:olfactory receptor-like protein OLF4 n=1 Tax=Suncus etruscus TaxID=109475 RepID=UPI00210F8480|nr:olfactory receptor-like protein OLF4 [Suncus etruscus]
MTLDNSSQMADFLLHGFPSEPKLQPLIFGMFLSMYLVTVLGNLLIILAVSSDPHLHTPMYFFLSNLSLVDIDFTSTTVPKMLANIQTQHKGITYKACLTQMYFVILFGVLDIFLLTVMAYDRFVAICHPLHYTVIMNPQLCRHLVLGSWLLSALNSLLHCLMALRLSFCTDLEIPNFFCELKPMVQLACSDTFINNVVMYSAAVVVAGGALAGILYSYSKIVASICGISSAQGKYKAFSTCASHLSVVSLFFCTVLGIYLSSAATHGSQSSSIASVMYAVVTPMLNPFIYSLRNKDIKRALKALLAKGSTKIQVVFTTGSSLHTDSSGWACCMEALQSKLSTPHWVLMKDQGTRMRQQKGGEHGAPSQTQYCKGNKVQEEAKKVLASSSLGSLPSSYCPH